MSGKTAQAARPRLYLDTSAYLGLLLQETRASELATSIKGAELLSSVLLVIEARRNLVRLTRERGITERQYALCMDRVAQDINQLKLRDLTLDLCDVAPMPPIATPRTLDLIHLRTAGWFHRDAPLDRFVTFDAVQQQAAKELGLPV